MSKLIRTYASAGDLPATSDGAVASVGGVLYVRQNGAWATLPLVASREGITGAGAITGSGDVLAEITTIGASYTVTLPAASDGQRIHITDRTGTAGTGSYLVRVAPNGAETIRIPGVGACAGIYLCDDSAAFTLVGVAGVGWEVVGGKGYAVDPRLISGLYVWLDARRGLTVESSRQISAWADISGSGHSFVQATANNRPVLSSLPNGLPALYANGAQTLVSGNASLASGALSVLALFSTPAPAADTTYRGLFGWQYGASTGAGLILSAGAIGADWEQYDTTLAGNGYTNPRAPRAIGYWQGITTLPYIRGVAPHVLAGRVSASSAVLQADGVSLASRVAIAGAVPNITNQPIAVMSEAAGMANPFLGWLGSFLLFSTDLAAADFAVLQADLLRQAGR